MYDDFFVPYPVIETKRLRLRMVRKNDAGQVYELCRRPETSMYSLWSPHRSLKETKEFIAYQIAQYRRGQCMFFVVEEVSSRRVIGTCSYVSFENDFKVAEIGYSILSDFWNRGFATETAGGLTGYAFDRIGAQRVFARVLPANTASARVLQKIGFEYEGTQKKGFYFNGKISDVDVYAMTDDMFFGR